MGYKPTRNLLKLNFAGTDLDGLEVTSRRVSIALMTEILGLSDVFDSLQGADPNKLQAGEMKEALGSLRKLFELFASVIVSWNVEDDDDQPVPPTAEGLMTLELDFVGAVIAHWVSSVSEAPPPLPGGSTGGSPPAGLDLEAASRSLPS